MTVDAGRECAMAHSFCMTEKIEKIERGTCCDSSVPKQWL
ncbi:hypothetical protein CLONEX_03248 [[Clostridium] nexile DSM 1787]|nr:hypothetical protein CLONEX_03248 [[Clostridium] nexile DSM 1787]